MMKTPYRPLGIRVEVWLIFILLFALFLRVQFFVGFANNDPQDDGIYINHASRVMSGEHFNFTWAQKLVSQEDMINPAHQFPFRWAMLLPTAASFSLFGVNDYSLGLYSLLCSLGSIVVIFYLGKTLFNERAGLIAAFLLSFFPLNVIHSTRLLPDVPIAFFMGLSVLLFLRGERKTGIPSYLLLILSGISLGIGYLAKVSSVILFVFIIGYLLFKWDFKKKHLLIFIGFILVFAAEGSYYYMQTGDFFLHSHLYSKVYLFKYDTEIKGKTQSLALDNLINVEYIPHQVKFYPLLLLNMKPGWRSRVIDCFGYFYYALIASLVILALMWLRRKAPKNAWIPALWVILLFMFLQFGPMNLQFAGDDFLVNYLVIAKIPRYLTVLSIPAMLVIASLLSSDRWKIKWIVTPIVLLFLLYTSIPSLGDAQGDLSSKVSGVRDAAYFLKEMPPKNIYSDYVGRGHIKYYFGLERGDYLKSFGRLESPDKFEEDSYVVVGGSRGAVSCSHVMTQLTPEFLRSQPDGWILMMNITSGVESCNKKGYNTKVYYIPPRE